MTPNPPSPHRLQVQAVELIVERAEAQFDDGVDNLSRAITKITIPTTIGDDQYRTGSTDFSFEQMVKLYLYRRVRGHSQSEMIEYLERQPYLKQRFGFDDTIPRQQTLSRTEAKRFTPETKRALDIAAEGIANEAHDRQAIVQTLSPVLLETNDDAATEDPSKREYKRQQAQKSIRFARRHVIPQFQTARADNKTYSDEAIFDILARICANNGSANSEGEYGWIADDDYTPDGSTILRALKQIAPIPSEGGQTSLGEFDADADELPDIARIRDAVLKSFDTATENVISSIDGDDPFSDRYTVAAIDMTYEQIYVSPWKDRENGIPNPSFPKMASGYKHDDDYRRGFKYATITLVGDNVPIILGIEPVKSNSNWEQDGAMSYTKASIVDRLLARAQQFVDIDLVLFDREFYSHDVFATVDRRDVLYLTPKKEYEDDYRNIADIEEHPDADAAVRHDVESSAGGWTHGVEFLYVPSREEEGKYAVFATNMDRVEPEEIDHVVNTYRRRWDIENEFKTIKEYMPRTSSMDFQVRLTNFVFATIVYNLWRLADYLIKRALDTPVRDPPVITAKTFVRAVGEFLRELD